jgi:hypothetical protein
MVPTVAHCAVIAKIAFRTVFNIANKLALTLDFIIQNVIFIALFAKIGRLTNIATINSTLKLARSVH